MDNTTINASGKKSFTFNLILRFLRISNLKFEHDIFLLFPVVIHGGKYLIKVYRILKYRITMKILRIKKKKYT